MQPTPVLVPIAVGDDTFAINFLVVPGQQRYAVYLDRLWFWGGLKQVGMDPRVGEVNPAVQVSVIHRARRDDILY